jgi:hypothetical protein
MPAVDPGRRPGGAGASVARLRAQLSHAGLQEQRAAEGDIRRLEFLQRPFERPAQVSRSQAPDLSPDLRLALSGPAEPGGQAHRRGVRAPAGA